MNCQLHRLGGIIDRQPKCLGICVQRLSSEG